ncbi:polysaccharide deacetylase family protein [Anaerobacillus isosaccharinicus]|uniref:Polysaccharide deacetylase n=1 Tax=Anaerobacillus isosaccharinicus TaxID=1532552 RepID=A0A1S2LPZ2_9BACI|nr:polysaccharide deacetylase family protein [Anaerobacillus isosaccharinicus]MBA5586254.1 polysaccharide deacetylase family protein [Anaerobacillus isosaccharinicus]QOY35494.1 polysaccharide deacetylase family protein [Anaerobacillus isosaccharinicus]
MYDLKDERWVKNVQKLNGAGKKVVLTFDDGPSRQLPEILAILKEKNVVAHFFWLSKLLYPERPWIKVLEEGHKIGSHTKNHKNLIRLTYEKQYRQIKNSVKKIEAITGVKVRYFRPPFGQYNENTLDILAKLEVIPVMWEISSYDWEHKASPERIVDNVVSYARDGSIILLHETKQTVIALPKIIDGLRRRGFEFSLIE